MSPVDNNKAESPSLCNLARIDTSNDWSDLESLGSLHSPSRAHLISSHTKRNKSIEVIPSTPNGGYLSNDEDVTSLRELDSIMVPSSTESETTIDIDEPFASFVISVTNLDDEGTQTQEWETTLLDDNKTTMTGVASQTKHPCESSSERHSTIKTNTASRGQTIHTSSNNKNTTTAALKPVIRPRQPAVSALDKENNTTIPLRRTSGHRRVGFNSLPSPRDLEEHGVEMSYTTKEATQNTKQQQRANQKKHAWTHRRNKVLNATTGFR